MDTIPANSETSSSLSLTDVVSTAIQIPGVRVNRGSFLCETFKEADKDTLQAILEKGPVEAGVGQAVLKQKAHKLIQARTALSAGASFAAGLPGGLALAATIPADTLQFYAVALRMAQELAYLYGESDLWERDLLDRDKVTNQLVLYCGVMLGASGASQSVRILSSAMAAQALKKLPQQPLTKTFYYPVIKSVARFFGVSMTKNTFAKGVFKAVPVVGGFVSGGITLATLAPMGLRLANTLEQAHFGYDEKSFQADWQRIAELTEQEENAGVQHTGSTAASEKATFRMQPPSRPKKAKGPHRPKAKADTSAMDEIRKAKQLLDEGILTQEEFAQAKSRLLETVGTKQPPAKPKG